MPPAPPSQRRAFSTIFLIELWERFGYSGMASLLVLFMVQKEGFGDQQANLIWGAFTALVYTAPTIGGWIGDKVLGTRRTVPIGAGILALGYLLLSIVGDGSYPLYCAMGVIVVGNGLFKPNAANMVRRIYEGEDAKIDSAFTLYYMAVNVGSTMSILLAPWIKDRFGWHAAFAICCGGLLLGLINYLVMLRSVDGIGSPADEQPIRWNRLALVLIGAVATVGVVAFVIQHREVAMTGIFIAGIVILAIFAYMIKTGARHERAGMLIALILVVETWLFFIFYQQMSTSLTLFALRNVDWNQNLFGMHVFTWSAAQYQALNPIWIMLLSPLLAWTYRHFGKRGRDLPIAGKFAIGFAVVAIGFLIFGTSGASAVDGKVSSWFMVWGYGFYSLGELLVGALGLAMISRYVPLRMSGFMMGAYFVAVAISQYLGSVVANYASIPENISDPLASLAIYTSLFNNLGLLAIAATVLAVVLLPLTKRLSATTVRCVSDQPSQT
ncbi:MFS transporter [Pseudolysobacter antarcticus]|uniref:MFS transporter n=2 Tax=Pseudolysobacter antarcticus TaxID=2511995 RepID=A0A411HQK3_9GAMM|nr:MFS transporter [Pseudolysobacter antarcticus]